MIEGETFFDLIENAGGYTSNAFPEGAVYINEEAKEISLKAIERLYDEFIDGLIAVLQRSSSDLDMSSLVALSEQLKDSEPNGRIIIDLMDESSQTFVKDGDSLVVPERSNNIFIYGEVLSEGALLFKKGADLEFYIGAASGLKEQANTESIFIMYPNGQTKQLSRKRNLFANQSQEIVIEAGSIIYVSKKIDDTISSRLTAQAYAAILGNVSLALASINSINK
jgi:hypothetical protein